MADKIQQKKDEIKSLEGQYDYSKGLVENLKPPQAEKRILCDCTSTSSTQVCGKLCPCVKNDVPCTVLCHKSIALNSGRECGRVIKKTVHREQNRRYWTAVIERNGLEKKLLRAKKDLQKLEGENASAAQTASASSASVLIDDRPLPHATSESTTALTSTPSSESLQSGAKNPVQQQQRISPEFGKSPSPPASSPVSVASTADSSAGVQQLPAASSVPSPLAQQQQVQPSSAASPDTVINPPVPPSSSDSVKPAAAPQPQKATVASSQKPPGPASTVTVTVSTPKQPQILRPSLSSAKLKVTPQQQLLQPRPSSAAAAASSAAPKSTGSALPQQQLAPLQPSSKPTTPSKVDSGSAATSLPRRRPQPPTKSPTVSVTQADALEIQEKFKQVFRYDGAPIGTKHVVPPAVVNIEDQDLQILDVRVRLVAFSVYCDEALPRLSYIFRFVGRTGDVKEGSFLAMLMPTFLSRAAHIAANTGHTRPITKFRQRIITEDEKSIASMDIKDAIRKDSSGNYWVYLNNTKIKNFDYEIKRGEDGQLKGEKNFSLAVGSLDVQLGQAQADSGSARNPLTHTQGLAAVGSIEMKISESSPVIPSSSMTSSQADSEIGAQPAWKVLADALHRHLKNSKVVPAPRSKESSRATLLTIGENYARVQAIKYCRNLDDVTAGLVTVAAACAWSKSTFKRYNTAYEILLAHYKEESLLTSFVQKQRSKLTTWKNLGLEFRAKWIKQNFALFKKYVASLASDDDTFADLNSSLESAKAATKDSTSDVEKIYNSLVHGTDSKALTQKIQASKAAAAIKTTSEKTQSDDLEVLEEESDEELLSEKSDEDDDMEVESAANVASRATKRKQLEQKITKKHKKSKQSESEDEEQTQDSADEDEEEDATM